MLYCRMQGTTVMGCIGLCHENPNYWPDPERFNPDRFLNSEGKFVPQKEGFLPFSIGKLLKT